MKLRLLVSALALCACAGTPSPELAPVPSNTATDATFAEIVNSARALEMREVDATKLGDRADVYVVTRSGAWFDTTQRLELVLVLIGGGETLRVELGSWAVEAPTHAPFGALEAVPVCDEDAHDLACRVFGWAGVEPRFALTLQNASGGVTRCSVSIEDGGILFLEADGTWNGDGPEEWREERLALSSSTRVFTPAPPIVAPVLGDPVVVRLSDDEVGPHNSVALYQTSLRVGDRLGQLAMPIADNPDPDRWEVPAIARVLPGPLPDADAYLAHRLYRSGMDVDAWLLGRVGDELVGWARFTGPSVVELPWRETLRVPLPDDAQVVVRPRVE